jgi:hypothetical protein
MISFASWATPGNHPYLARPTLKRKHSYCNDSSSEPSPETASSELLYFAAHSRHATVDPTTPVSVRESLAPEPHDSKRRRLELERDFRQLKLEQQAREEQMQAVKARDAMYRLWEMDGEVDMDDAPPVELSGGRTWYEPEKDSKYLFSVCVCVLWLNLNQESLSHPWIRIRNLSTTPPLWKSRSSMNSYQTQTRSWLKRLCTKH